MRALHLQGAYTIIGANPTNLHGLQASHVLFAKSLQTTGKGIRSQVPPVDGSYDVMLTAQAPQPPSPHASLVPYGHRTHRKHSQVRSGMCHIHSRKPCLFGLQG